MKRKIVKQGSATLMISLPSKWTKKMGLGKGDEIDISEKDNYLIISPDGKSVKKETSLQIGSENETSIRTLITNAYRLGYDKVNVYFKSEVEFDYLKEDVKKLIGYDIISKEKNRCVIENITEPSVEKFDPMFMKIIYNIDELFTILKLKLGGDDVFEEFNEVESRIKKYDDFCRRILIKTNAENIHLIWAFHTKLIHAQRDLYHLLRYIGDKKVKISKDTLLLAKGANDMFNLLKEAYKKRDIESLEKIHNLEKDLVYNKGYKLFNKEKESIILFYLVSSIRNFYLASSPLIGANITNEHAV